jgi:peptidyl-prolyl cis-trans isomerase A (cyclophilin A)
VKVRSKLHFLAGLTLGVALIAGGAFARAESQTSSQKSTTSTHKRTAHRMTHATYDHELLHPAMLHARAPETYDVKFVTTKGDFTIRVHRDWAPLGADRFYNLVEHHFYNEASFFRVLPGFVVQFGVSAYPPVARVWSKADLKDDPVKQSNRRGTVTFATAGPNTRTTQVFINLGNNGGLDGQGFAPFGEVVAGMDVVGGLYSGYGEGASNNQNLIQSEGKTYLDKNFPKLDSIRTATLVTAGGSSPSHTTHHPAGHSTTKP